MLKSLLFTSLFIFTFFTSFTQEVAVKLPTDTLNLLEDTTEVPDYFPTIAVNAGALETEAQTQDVSGLLQSSRDVYTSIAGFNFGAARFKIRGYQSDNFTILMNGVKMNDIESGRVYWGNWGGLNDITRYQNIDNGISASQLNFGGTAGVSNIEIRASKIRKQHKISYALSNRSYRQRVILTESTGLMKNGWAIAMSGAFRYAKEGYVEGTNYESGALFVSIEKKINNRHSIGFSGFVSPTKRGRSGIVFQEVYDITGNNFYNQNWGYQTNPKTGKKEKRNYKERRTVKPYLFLTHYFEINKNSNLNTTVYGNFGKSGNTNVDWYDAKDPRPSYYKYLPSYYAQTDPEVANQLTNSWQNDPSVNQFDWDQLYFANSKNLYTVNNPNGEGGSLTGNRSKYIIKEYRTDPRSIGFNTNYFKKVNENLKWSSGLNAFTYKSKNFSVVDDLLGGDYFVDVNQFAERDFPGNEIGNNNVEIPNRIVYKGDKYGYNYDINYKKIEGFTQAEINLSKFDFYAAANLSYTTFWRTGNWKNALFPDDSKGDSKKVKMLNYGLKAGITYKITGRHYLNINGLYATKAPTTRNTFVSPRYRNTVVNNGDVKPIKTSSFDANYLIRYPKLKLRATYFYTQENDITQILSYYHDLNRSFVNYIMNGVNKLYTGGELGFDYNLTSTVRLKGAFTKAEYVYNSRPSATITVDNSNELKGVIDTVFIKNFKLGGTPQSAASMGVAYRHPKFWFLEVNFNYFADRYLGINPDRRTKEALSSFVASDPQVAEIVTQEKLDNAYTVNLSLGKSFRIDHKYYISVNLNVNNILNNTTLVSGGYENLRANYSNINKFPSKIGYSYGRTYFLSVSFRF